VIFGFNTEVRIGSNVFHVQTEDHGAQKHLIETTVYAGGRLVHRRKVSYEELLESPNFSESEVRSRLEDQHRAVIEELRSGALTFEIPPAPPKPSPKPAVTQVPAASKPAPAKPPAPTVMPQRPAAPKPAVVPPPATAPVAAALARPAAAPAAQILNPASWYAAGTATLKIDVKSKSSNEPLADAMLLVLIQSPTGPITFAAKSDARGRVELVFPLPKMGPSGADVIIRTPDNAEDEIRYSLKPSSETK
jgi:hypothetical protein